MAADWYLIVIIIVMVVALLFCNLYILVYFQHADDKNTAYFPKLLVVFGLLLGEATILLLPLDVANNTTALGCQEGWNKECGNLDMELLWLIVFLSIIFIIVVLLPFSIYYYESDDGDDSITGSRRFLEAFKMECLTLLFTIALLVILYVTSSKSKIPMKATQVFSESIKSGFHSYIDGSTLTNAETANATSITKVLHVTVNVSFPIYTIGLASFLGWFGFSIFTGIGLVALPMDLILAFVNRPKYISADVYAHQKLAIQRRSLELIDIGKQIKTGMERPGQHNKSSKERRKQRRVDFITVNKFKQAVYLLETDMEDLQLCHEGYKNFNPLIPLFKLFLGCICSIVSLIWICHIALYMLPATPLLPFLNDYFIWFDSWFPLFGTISIGIFSLFLLACSVKGCFKFGMRCFCFALHPMELHGTYMNSLLFNLALVLMCSIPAVQFCDQAFKEYGRLTAIRTLFGVQIQNLRGMNVFWIYNIFIYAILCICLLSGIFLGIKPKDKASALDNIRKKIEQQVREDANIV